MVNWKDFEVKHVKTPVLHKMFTLTPLGKCQVIRPSALMGYDSSLLEEHKHFIGHVAKWVVEMSCYLS